MYTVIESRETLEQCLKTRLVSLNDRNNLNLTDERLTKMASYLADGFKCSSRTGLYIIDMYEYAQDHNIDPIVPASRELASIIQEACDRSQATQAPDHPEYSFTVYEGYFGMIISRLEAAIDTYFGFKVCINTADLADLRKALMAVSVTSLLAFNWFNERSYHRRAIMAAATNFEFNDPITPLDLDIAMEYLDVGDLSYGTIEDWKFIRTTDDKDFYDPDDLEEDHPVAEELYDWLLNEEFIQPDGRITIDRVIQETLSLMFG